MLNSWGPKGTFQTNPLNYKKAKTGMPCCSKQLQSEAVTKANKLRGKKNKQ